MLARPHPVLGWLHCQPEDRRLLDRQLAHRDHALKADPSFSGMPPSFVEETWVNWLLEVDAQPFYRDQLQLGMDSHDVQHLIVHVATSLQRITLKAEEDKQYAAAVGAQKMIYELLMRRKLDHEAEKASRPGWGYLHGKTRS